MTMTSAELRREIAARGWNRRPTGRIVGELLVHVSLAIAGGAVFIFAENWFARVCGLIVMVAGSMGVGTNSHTSSHYASSDRRWVNEALTFFGFPFFLGLSATFWIHSHVVVHHPAPNVIGVDKDADLLPLFAMTEGEARRGGKWRRWYYERAQWLVFPLALAANGLNYIKKGWRHLIRALRDPGKRTRAHWIDLAALISHQVVYLGVPMFFFSARDVVGFYAIRLALLGYAMFATLAPGHFPAEATRLAADQKDADYFLLQTSGSTNFRAGRIGSFFVSGLDYQIEHHLFPNVSHVHYREMSEVIKKFCRENGLPYHVFRWDHILWKCWMAVRWPRPVVADAESLRLPSKQRAREMAAQSSAH